LIFVVRFSDIPDISDKNPSISLPRSVLLVFPTNTNFLSNLAKLKEKKKKFEEGKFYLM